MKTFGDMIQTIMIEKDIKSVRELDRITGISNTYLGMLMNAKNNISPTLDTIKLLCEKTHFSLERFLNETGYINSGENTKQFNYYPADLNLDKDEMLIIGNGGEKKIVKLNEMQKKIFDTIIEDADKNKK